MAAQLGVYSALVLDNRDPEGLARVRVRVSGLDGETGAGLWARVSTLMAGRNCGTWFMPAVGDEVLVAFEGGDARTPCVLGALWSANARPPETGDMTTVTEMIRSRNGLTLRILDDAGKGSVIVETAAGQRITLEDGTSSVRVEDGNGNSVTLASSGVTINASASVTISAAAVDVNAGTATINAGMARFSGVVQCDTLVCNSVISASYSPGAGNLQ